MVDMDQAYLAAKRARLIPTGFRPTVGGMVKVNESGKMAQSIAQTAYTIMYGLSSPHGQDNIQQTLQRSVIRKFVPYVNMRANANPARLHHVYEWNHTGQTGYRLFQPIIDKTQRRKATFNMTMTFTPSKTLVPLSEAQLTPGPSGKVVKKRYKFYNKASVMEFGETVTIRRRGSSMLAFGESQIMFSAGPIIIDYSDRPNHLAFSRVTADFFTRLAPPIADQAMEAYSRKVSAAANVSSVVMNVMVPSDALAKSKADAQTRKIGPVGV